MTITLDTVTGDNIDTPDWWQGPTVLLGTGQSVHVLALDGWNNRLRYHGCSSACDEAAHWLNATVDSAPFGYSQYSIGAVLTSAGISVVYSSQEAIRYLHCGSGCDATSHWSATTLFPGSVLLDHAGWVPSHDTPLAADGAGGLHLLFLSSQGQLLHYAFCGGACDAQASWQDVALDSSASALSGSARLIAVAPGGGVHVLYGSSAGLMHAACSANCLAASSWRYEVVGGTSIQGTLRVVALAFGPDGRLHVASADQSTTVRYATCGAPCSAPGTWSVASLPHTTTDVGLAVNRAGRVYLATTDRTVVVSRCAASCLDRAAWQSVAVDAALGDGRVAIAADTTDRVRVASSHGEWPMILQLSLAAGP